jgi:putative peptidoglycan lipid II flippase
MLTAAEGLHRVALFRKLRRWLGCASAAAAAVVIVTAPSIMRLLAPGLDPQQFGTAVTNLRVLSLAGFGAGFAAVHSAMLYTARRFAPTAFYQALLNLFTGGFAIFLWNWLGIYSFVIGYATGSAVHLSVVWYACRKEVHGEKLPECRIHWRELLAKPAFFAVYAAGLALNITFTRAWATHGGPGMAAALDYCMRGVAVPLALVVTPISNSLLPEIARLRSVGHLRDAFRLIDRTVALTALAVVAGCVFALLLREPVIALLFQRGSFTAESTKVVSAAFLGLGPSLIGWSLMEIVSRSLFALDRPWPPVIAAAVPVIFNVALTLRLQSLEPQLLGMGASLGLLAGLAGLLVMARARRRRWLAEA